jgi:serine/threonine-protein kinase
VIARSIDPTINELTETDLDRPTEEMFRAEPPPRTDPMLGDVLHGFRIEKLIGQGSAARIYHAIHLVLDREYAVKILHPEFCENRDAVGRLRREARLLSKIRHPNIVEVHDFGETANGRPFIAMELLSGKTLKSVIDNEGALPKERALSIVRQIAAGLQEAHRVGLVHRDLKPENIMLVGERGKEVAKILDFGLARAFRNDSRFSMITGADILLGTPRYMAPEQILSPSSAGPSSDLYALGVILHEMLSGEPMFSGEIFEVIEAQLNRRPPQLSETGSLERLTMRLLDKDPANRLSAAGVIAELDRFENGRRDTLKLSPKTSRTPAPVLVAPQLSRPVPVLPSSSSSMSAAPRGMSSLTIVLGIIGFTMMLLAGFAAGQEFATPVVMVLPDSPLLNP